MSDKSDAKSMIRDITASFALARAANIENAPAKELKYLLDATRSIVLLLSAYEDVSINKTYSVSLVSSSARIRDILFSGEI